MGLFTPAWKGDDEKKAMAYIEKCENEKKLAQIVRENPGWGGKRRDAALKKLTDQKELHKIVMESGYLGWKSEDIFFLHLTDQGLLADITWRAKDYHYRDEATRRLTDQKVLEELAQKSDRTSVRVIAVSKLENQEVIQWIAEKDRDTGVHRAALNRIKDAEIWQKLALNGPDPQSRITAVNNLIDQAKLADIARLDSDAGVRKAAALRLSNQKVLAELAAGDKDRDVRSAVVSQLTEQDTLATVALTEQDNGIRHAAVSKLTDQEILMEIAKSDKDAGVREIARKGITDRDKQIELSLSDDSSNARIWGVNHIPPDDERLLHVAMKDKNYAVRYAATKRMKAPELLRQAAAQGLDGTAEKLTEKEDLLFAAKRNGSKAVLKRMRELGYLDEKTLQGIIEGAEYADLSNISLELDKTRFLDDLEKKRLYYFRTAYETRDVAMLRKEPTEESIMAAILLLREFGRDGTWDGPSDLAYKCSHFLHDMYRLHPELREAIKKANSYSVNAHEDRGGSSCHEDHGPLIFDFK